MKSSSKHGRAYGRGFSLSSSGSGEDVSGCSFVSASAEETSSKHGSSCTWRGSKGEYSLECDLAELLL